MASTTMSGVMLPCKSVARTQQRSSQRPAAFGSSFAKGSGTQFSGRSLQLDAPAQAGSARSVTTMAAKGGARRGPGAAGEGRE